MTTRKVGTKRRKAKTAAIGPIHMGREAALKFIEQCERRGDAVLGIEGFAVSDEGRRPRMDLIADFSPTEPRQQWEDYRSQVNREARRFVEGAPSSKDLVFEFVTWSKHDWAAD